MSIQALTKVQIEQVSAQGYCYVPRDTPGARVGLGGSQENGPFILRACNGTDMSLIRAICDMALASVSVNAQDSTEAKSTGGL